jgi:hypothetical protein
VLTAENLFDGTIMTNTEHYYIEPSHKYLDELPQKGIHSIIYKLSDVKMDIHKHNNDKSDHETHCASEKLYKKMKNEQIANRFDNVNEKSEINVNNLKLKSDGDDVISKRNQDKPHKRMKRWLQVRRMKKSP